ncbi:MAG: DNA-3-methyladenine glycosylase [Terracidiphilus sp.]
MRLVDQVCLLGKTWFRTNTPKETIIPNELYRIVECQSDRFMMAPIDAKVSIGTLVQLIRALPPGLIEDRVESDCIASTTIVYSLLSGSMPTASKLPARFDTDGDLRRLSRAELPVDTEELARYLIGKVIVHDTAKGRLGGRIVETEAYPVGDAAGHAFRGRTPRNGPLFLERGHAYVYLAYGVSFLLNVTSERAGIGAGVLLRAIEPLEGTQLMEGTARKKQWPDIGRGPGRLTKALKVDLRQDGADLCNASSSLWLAETTRKTGAIGKSVRIGLTQAVDRLLRFYERGSKHISGPKRLLRG